MTENEKVARILVIIGLGVLLIICQAVIFFEA